MAASCGWAAVTSELLGRAGTQVTVVVAPRPPFDPRRTAPEPVLPVPARLPSVSSAAPAPARGDGDAGEELEQRRLAAAVAAAHPQRRPRWHLDGQVPQHPRPAPVAPPHRLR